MSGCLTVVPWPAYRFLRRQVRWYGIPISFKSFPQFVMIHTVKGFQFSSVQSLSHVWLFETPWTVAHQASLSITTSQSFLKLMSIESVLLSNHLILCHPLLLPSVFPSIKIFSNESALRIRWPKYWSFSISHSSEYSGLISFRIDWLDLLAVQGTLKSLPQHHSSKASILQCSAFFMVQLSHPYMTIGKTTALTVWTFFQVACSIFIVKVFCFFFPLPFGVPMSPKLW